VQVSDQVLARVPAHLRGQVCICESCIKQLSASGQGAELLQQYLVEVLALADQGEVLDLACGNGHNGLKLAAQGARLVFADRDSAMLQGLEQRAQPWAANTRIWQVDLEEPAATPLAGQQFAAILVFRYLHRPLIPAIREALIPGGLLVYETFTTVNRQFGRPNRAEFLLEPDELRGWFADWEIVHYQELVESAPVERAVAQLVVRKPSVDDSPAQTG
jgi:SAM-dependent methyltransferase